MATFTRRTMLQFAGAVGVGVGLSACSGGGTGRGASPADAAAWPTYQAAKGPKPDLASTVKGGGEDAFFNYPSELATTVTDKPGDGSTISSLILTYSPPIAGAASNQMWSAINKALNADVRLNMIPASEYGSKLAAITASNDLPDTMLMTALPRAKQFVKAKCADLTDYLSGDAILEYPNLAAIPTYAWQVMGRVNGGIYGIPLPRGRVPGVLHVNRTVLGGAEAPDPWTKDQFVQAMTSVTSGDRYGLGVWSGEPYLVDLFAGAFGAPNTWDLRNGQFSPAQASDPYREAIAFATDLFKRGLFHPSSSSASQNDIMNDYYASKIIGVEGSFANYSTGIYFQRVGERFTTDLGPIFAPDFRNSLSDGMFGYTVFKQADPERIKMLLRICDYLAAPYGSVEWELVHLGVEGAHFTRTDGGYELTKLADAENQNTVGFKYLANPMEIIQVPGNKDATKRAFEVFEKLVKAGTPDPSASLDSDTLDTAGPTLLQKYYDATVAIVSGRADISSWDKTLAEVKAAGGDKIAEELATSAAAH